MAITLPPAPNAYDAQWMRTVRDLLSRVIVGMGSPAGVVVANRGTLYLRTDGGAATTLYVKEGNDGTSAGWVGK